MHARFSQLGPAHAVGPIKGTFYPTTATHGASLLPRLLAVLAAVAFVRMIATGARRHGPGGSRWEGRRRRLAELHRELHRADEGTAKAAEEVSA